MKVYHHTIKMSDGMKYILILILYLQPMDHYNDKGHVTRNNIQYIC